MMLFIQKLPTDDWGDQEIELVLSEAFMVLFYFFIVDLKWKTLFGGSPNHLN